MAASADMKKLRGMDPAELAKEEAELRGAVWKLRLQLGTGQLQDPSKVKRARRDLARLLTVKRERDLAEARTGRS